MLRYLKNIFFTFKKKLGRKSSDKIKSNANFDFNKKLVYSLSKSKIPTLKQIKYLKKYLNKKELLLINLSVLLIFLSLSFLAVRFYLNNVEIIPAKGGEYTEGLIGSPKHINPLYASINDVDNDIASLVFSSLYKRGSNGELIEDLVESVELSADEKEYTFKIKPNVFWHDGNELGAKDVSFTINTILNSAYQSPLRQSLSGALVKIIDDRTFVISLIQPYGAFKDLLTFGIMPAHLWEQLAPEAILLNDLNLKPIGSGPYKFKRFLKDSGLGRILSFELIENENYYGQAPNIEKITFKFYPNFEELLNSLNNGLIDAIAYLPKELKSQVASQNSLNFYNLELSKILALYFNVKSSSAVEKKNIRQALSHAIDKQAIVEEVFSDNARLADSSLLLESFAYNPDVKKYDYNKEIAVELLEKEGWKISTTSEEDLIKEEGEEEVVEEKTETGKWFSKNTDNNEKEFLVVEIAIVESLDNMAIANLIKKYWEEIGVKTIIKTYDSKNINSEIIRERNYESLLYTQSLAPDPDVYALWHSSQAVAGGNNLSNYFNSEVDKLLNEARLLSDKDLRKEKYFEFQDILIEDNPAIFISSPRYTYVQKKDIKNFNVTSISTPSNRFSNISDWYIHTGRKIIW